MDEIYGGNYVPFDFDKVEQDFEDGKIDHNDYIKLYKHGGGWDDLKNGRRRGASNARKARKWQELIDKTK